MTEPPERARESYYIMRALSIQQPWAWLIAAGHKDIENRTWPTRRRGRFLIHAGKKYGEPRDYWEWAEIERPDTFLMGGVIGEAEIIDCVTSSRSPWFCGPYGFVIHNARLVSFRPYRGSLGFFEIDARELPLPMGAK